MKKKLLRCWPWLAAICSGLLAAGAFPPFNQTWLIWIAWVPLICAALFSGDDARRRWLRDLALGYVAGLAFFWTCFFWLTTVTALGWFVMQFYLALYPAVWAWFCGLMRPRAARLAVRDKWSEMLSRAHVAPPPSSSPWLSSAHNLFFAFSLAAAWTALEWTRGWLMSGFGWNGLGVALHATWPMIQIAEFTGVCGVSFIVMFCNAILAATARRLWQETHARLMRPHFDLTLTLVGLVAIFAIGLHAVQKRPETRLLHVALVQSNVEQSEKFDLRFKEKIFDKFAHLSQLALTTTRNVELLVWPESAMAAPVLQDWETLDFVRAISERQGVDLLLGAIQEEPLRVYNAALLFRPGRDVQIYRKVHLVPFGEYIPFRHSFPLFARIAGDQVPEDFDAGGEITVFELSGGRGRLAPLICFEDTLGDLTRRFVLQGADLLVTLTNDAWFLRSAGSEQHLANAVFRCVETRRPMVRSANTGVTCFVNDLGRVTQILRDDHGSTFDEGILAGDVNLPFKREMTFYARNGELFAKLCAVAAGVIALLRMAMAASKRAAFHNDAR